MQWEKIHSIYENKAYRIIRKHIKKIVSKIPLDNITFANAEATVKLNFDNSDVLLMYFAMYKRIGLLQGKEMLRQIDKDTKALGIGSFEGEWASFIEKWIIVNLGTNIASVSNSMIEEIVNIIKGSYAQELTIDQIRNQIFKTINDRNFYKWQAMRIARTETTTIANFSNWFAAERSNIVFDKQWVSIPDNRTRHRPEDMFDHRQMNGVAVGFYEKFNVNGNPIDYPGDPINGLAGNIINCRCTMNFVPKKDINGLLIRK